jgi:hypothetical protein
MNKVKFAGIFRLIIVLSVFSLIAGCGGGGGGSEGDNSTNPEEEIVTGNGVVQFVDVEGGCWRIVGDNDSHYEPINLSDEFKKDGLAVQFEAKFRKDLVTFCQVGAIVEIVSINK